MIISIAFRNILRHRRRSLISGLSMVVGFALFSFSMSVSEGSYSDIIELFTNESVGHVQVYSKDYLDRPAIYKTIKNPKNLIHKLNMINEVHAVSPRVYGGGLGFFNNKTAAVSIVGIDNELENKVTSILRKRLTGRLPQKGKYEAVVSKKVFKNLKLSIGDKLVMISQGADGSVANDFFIISGVADYTGSLLGEDIVLSDIESVGEFLSLGDRVHQLVIKTKNYKAAKEAANALRATDLDSDLTVYSWQESQKSFYRAMEADKKGNYVTLFILMIVVGLGVLNAIFMNVYENMKDYAVMKSLGTRPFQIAVLIISESLLLGLLASIPGFLVALGVNYYFSINGIILPSPIEYGGIIFKEIRAIVEPYVFYTPFLVVICTALFASLLPARHAAKADPCQLMRVQ